LQKEPAWVKVIPRDPDLSALKDDAEFQALVKAANDLLR
jgi:hypothetical protein